MTDVRRPAESPAPGAVGRQGDGSDDPAAGAAASGRGGPDRAEPAAVTPSAAADVDAPRPRLVVQPEAEDGTSEALREAARRSLVPRWRAAFRTRAFSSLAVAGLLVFAGLTGLVTTGLTAGVDLAVTRAIQSITLPGFGALMLGASLPGFPPQSALVVLGVVALFWFAGYRTEAGFALAASASAIVTETVKSLVNRPRPDAALVNVLAGADGHSFPSGHTLFYVTFFGFLAYLAYAQLRPGVLRSAVLVATVALVLAIGPSRIWMGHHWVSDVLASYALGLTYLVLLVQVYSRRRLARPRRPVAAGAG